MLPVADLGIYIHVPFCAHICPYCDFIKTTQFNKKTIGIYISQLLVQYNHMKTHYLGFQYKGDPSNSFLQVPKHKPLATLYFGGGTPALLSGNLFAELVDTIKQDFSVGEFTVEANPFTLKESKVQSFLDLGCNRMTLGAQSMCEHTLKFLGRKHTPQQITDSVALIKSLGGPMMQLQIDLIYGLKEHVRSIPAEQEFENFVQMGATGVSCYALTLESRTLFADSENANDDVAADEYLHILAAAEKHNMPQIETSNFSFFPALHNSVYWTGLPYLGIGPGAHGLTPASATMPFGRRYRVGPSQFPSLSPGNDDLMLTSNRHDSKASSVSNQTADFQAFSINWEPPRDKEDYRKEMMFTLTRLPEGIAFNWLSEHFGSDSHQKILKDAILRRAIAEDRIFLDDLGLKIQPAEKIRGDLWVAHLLKVLEGS